MRYFNAHSEHFFEMVQGILPFLHLFPPSSAQFVHHIDGGSKVIRFLLAREFEIGKDIGLPLVLVQVGVFLLKGFHELRVKLVNHFQHGFPMVFVVINGGLQILEKIGFFVAVQIIVQQQKSQSSQGFGDLRF